MKYYLLYEVTLFFFFFRSMLWHMIVIWEAVRFRLQSGFYITPFPWISESAILKSEFLNTEALKVKAGGPNCVSLLLFFTPTIKSFNSKEGGQEWKILRQSLGGKIKLILKVKNSILNFISEQCPRQRVGFCPLSFRIPAQSPGNILNNHSLHGQDIWFWESSSTSSP